MPDLYHQQYGFSWLSVPITEASHASAAEARLFTPARNVGRRHPSESPTLNPEAVTSV